MLNIFYGVLAALIVKEILNQIYIYLETYYIRLQGRKALKDLKVFRDHMEDLEADDLDNQFQGQQKTPQPRVITLGRGVTCLYGAARALYDGYFLALPNSAALGSSALRTGPATAANAADARALGSVTPAKYRAITDATAALRYVATIACAFALFILSLSQVVAWGVQPLLYLLLLAYLAKGTKGMYHSQSRP